MNRIIILQSYKTYFNSSTNEDEENKEEDLKPYESEKLKWKDQARQKIKNCEFQQNSKIKGMKHIHFK